MHASRHEAQHQYIHAKISPSTHLVVTNYLISNFTHQRGLTMERDKEKETIFKNEYRMDCHKRASIYRVLVVNPMV